MFNQSQPFEIQVMSKVGSKEARKAIYKQVGIETASAHQWTAEQAQVKPLTIDTSTGSVVKMELGSPMTKMRRVTTYQEAEPSMSRESSQVEQVIDLMDKGDSSDEEMVLEATVAHPVKVKSEQLEDDDVFTGLVDCDDDKGDDDDDENDDENDDDEKFPGHIEMPDSDDSDFGAEGDQDSDQLEMQDIYDQQQRNRNTGQVSETKLMQVAETEDTEDTVDLEMHQMSLETEDSFKPLSMGHTEGQSTLPSSEDVEGTTQTEDTEDTVDLEMHQMSLETEDSFKPLSMGHTEGQSTLPSSEDVEGTTQDQEETLVMEEVKVSEKPKVARQPIELYQPPT